jgi:NAD(P)-dependent dehydrogenase (short-subunit alcohol dehydrogenase family)
VSFDPDPGLAGKGVVVTGVAGGIGRATATAFARAGARVCGVDVRGEQAAAVTAGLSGPGPHLALGADLTHLDGHDVLCQRVRDELGRLDVLAHVAAVLRRRADVDEVTETDWDVQLDVNLKASFFLARTAAGHMREQGRGGRIVTFTSQGWWTGGFGGSVVYCASKGGVVSLTRGLARTYAPHSITVNAVSPGMVDTPMLRDGMTEEGLAALVRRVPVGRMAEPDELAGAVVFLASRHAAYLTGATLNVSGGFLMY